MEKEIVYLVTKHGDKNHSIQLWSDDKEKINRLYTIFGEMCFLKQQISKIGELKNKINGYVDRIEKYISLNLFLQGYNGLSPQDKDFWIMLETWSTEEDLMIAFGEFCAAELNLKFEII